MSFPMYRADPECPEDLRQEVIAAIASMSAMEHIESDTWNRAHAIGVYAKWHQEGTFSAGAVYTAATGEWIGGQNRNVQRGLIDEDWEHVAGVAPLTLVPGGQDTLAGMSEQGGTPTDDLVLFFE